MEPDITIEQLTNKVLSEVTIPDGYDFIFAYHPAGTKGKVDFDKSRNEWFATIEQTGPTPNFVRTFRAYDQHKPKAIWLAIGMMYGWVE